MQTQVSQTKLPNLFFASFSGTKNRALCSLIHHIFPLIFLPDHFSKFLFLNLMVKPIDFCFSLLYNLPAFFVFCLQLNYTIESTNRATLSGYPVFLFEGVNATAPFTFGLKWFMEMFGIWYIPKAEVNCVLIDYRSGDRVKQKKNSPPRY